MSILFEARQIRGDGPAQFVCSQGQVLKVREGSQLDGNDSSQLVEAQMEIFRTGEIADFCRDAPPQVVVRKAQCLDMAPSAGHSEPGAFRAENRRIPAHVISPTGTDRSGVQCEQGCLIFCRNLSRHIADRDTERHDGGEDRDSSHRRRFLFLSRYTE